jgi:hypothetical protein
MMHKGSCRVFLAIFLIDRRKLEHGILVEYGLLCLAQMRGEGMEWATIKTKRFVASPI